MKVVFRRVPFCSTQRSDLERIAADAGCETPRLSEEIPAAAAIYFPKESFSPELQAVRIIL